MVFGIKMEDLRRTVGLVIGGHVTQMLDVITYFGMVTKKTISMALNLSMATWCLMSKWKI